jgi:serine/threonine protein kinase
MLGCRIGPYRITARIGIGQAGETYRATTDAEPAQHVAIKVTHHATENSDVLCPSLSDVSLQSRLRGHPNIRVLLGAGTLRGSYSYSVTEYVKGEPIDKYCDDHRLDIRARLTLFSQVCGAIQFAHRCAVIHGNLKSTNILVTEEGIPILIDFGTGELVHTGPADRENFMSSTACTPRVVGRNVKFAQLLPYTSPEQAMGGAVMTTTDVYALGIILYKLVTGRQPFWLESWTATEVCEAICNQVPERPSVAISRYIQQALTKSSDQITSLPRLISDDVGAVYSVRAKRLKRVLTGDLDAIVLKAMRKEPDQRYISVEQFSDDIRRHLNCLPVQARDNTLAYRTGKLIQRHRPIAFAGLLIFLALLAGGVTTSIDRKNAYRERDRARSMLNKSHQTLDLLFTQIST